MSARLTDEERITKMRKHHQELDDYLDHFADAFDELHAAVIKQVTSSGEYIAPHHDYPKMSLLDSGFPSFHTVGFYDNSAPLDYVGCVVPRGFAGLLAGRKYPKENLIKGAELASYLRTHDIGERLGLDEESFGGHVSDWRVDQMVADAVERYLQLYGIDAPVDPKRRFAVIMPMVAGTVLRRPNLRLVIPIARTHFEVDHFPLTDTAYITRLPKKLQLARARIRTVGTGATEMVVGAATHAFVSKDWQLEADNVGAVGQSLGHASPNVIDAVDSFFGALRIGTGISTGYAQLVWVPKGWALTYFCDLPPVYGTAIRQYPSRYDNFGWTRRGPTVSAEQLNEVRRIYRSVVANKSEAVRLALRRLNGCLTRTDDADAILDGTIGLELLLGDGENQALSYKLRLRAAALSKLYPSPPQSPEEIASRVKLLYSARSSIVHGLRKKQSKKISEPADRSHKNERKIASDLLRFVLDTLLEHPEYVQPLRIDEDLLLHGTVATAGVAAPKPRRTTVRH